MISPVQCPMSPVSDMRGRNTDWAAPAVASTAVIVAALVAGAFMQPGAQEPARPGDGLPAVPPGFDVERVAGPPLVDRPIVADFDEEGRLYVADSSGSNDKVEKQLADRPHRIVRLEDTNGDGRFDRSVVFADRMMLPEGTMWFDGSLYVAAPPSIWKLTDTNGDGVADQREEWFQGKTLTGCANDLHGPYLGPDGWIYWTKGAFAEQRYERPSTPPIVTKAAHIFRRRPGEPGIETVMTGGMDNPVDVAFTPGGERILTSTFVEHPQLGRRDGLIHAIYGGAYGKPHAVLEGHPRTGDLLPPIVHLGPAVPAGLTRYESNVFGDEYRDSFFAALFNMHKVTRVVLEPRGSTFSARESDFLVSANRDFHPTDVIEDADGSLLVIDTGPWYKLCCPTSQIAKPEVFGAIYRIRRRNAPAREDPRGLKVAWGTMAPAELVKLLDAGRPAVEHRALGQFAKLGAGAVPALDDILRTSPAPGVRRNAVWALTRIDAGRAREAVRFGLKDPDASVRLAALHSTAVWRDRGALPLLLEALESNLPAIQRAAAEALGRLGDPRAVVDLVAAASQADRVLEHSLTFALIEINDSAATAAAGREQKSSRGKRVALIALDQMGAALEPDALMPLFDASDPVLKETAWWIAGHHPEWGSALAGFFQQRLSDRNLSRAELDDLEQKLAKFADSGEIQTLLTGTLADSTSRDERLTVLAAMANAPSATTPRMKTLPSAWAAPLVRSLDSRDTNIIRRTIAVARAAPASKETAADLREALLHVARDRAQPTDVRLEALAATQEGLASVDADLFELLRASLDPSNPVMIRVAAASVIEKATLDRPQLVKLTQSLDTLGPLELPRVLRAFDNGSDEALGLGMIAVLTQSKARSSVRADVLRPRLAKYPTSVQTAGEAFLTSLSADSARQAQRLDDLLGQTQGGDVRRGQEVFNSQKAACMSCHAIGYIGGKLGPDLTKIGQVRSERDLLEAIVFPSASFARGYESVIVTTRSGQIQSGVLRSELRDEIVLAIGEREEARISRQQIGDMQPGTASLMPQGLDEILTRQELADLLAFLKAAGSGSH
jgi:putative membrane-bound dehydrogenase-like protein